MVLGPRVHLFEAGVEEVEMVRHGSEVIGRRRLPKLLGIAAGDAQPDIDGAWKFCQDGLGNAETAAAKLGVGEKVEWIDSDLEPLNRQVFDRSAEIS